VLGRAVTDSHVPRDGAVVHELTDGEAPPTLADVRLDALQTGRVTAGPGEARCEAEHLILLRTQKVLLLPAAQSSANDGDLILCVEEDVLTAQLGWVEELEGEAPGAEDRYVREVSVPTPVRLEVTFVHARCAVR